MVTAAKLAQVLGVNIRTIQRLTQESVLPSDVDPDDKRNKTYPLAASVQAYIASQLAKVADISKSDSARAVAIQTAVNTAVIGL